MSEQVDSIEVLDEKDRVIVFTKDDKTIFCRYVDLSEESKALMEEIYSGVSDDAVENLREFLEYREDSDEFCA